LAREGSELRRYAAPAVFLLAVTIAVVLVRSGLESGKQDAQATRTGTSPPETLPAAARRNIVITKGRQYWRVRAGDTFGVISHATGVPVRRLERLNPKVRSTTLFIGERVRIK
jgi:LysM domain-containing protein